MQSRRSMLSNVGEPVEKAAYNRFRHNSNRSLCVRNLPFHYKDENLVGLMRKILDCPPADVELCRVKYCRKDGAGKPLHLGYVLMRTEELAQHAIESLGRQPRHDGRDIMAEKFNERAANSDQSQSYEGSVFFSFESEFNEPRITEEVIRSHFENPDGWGNLQVLCIKAHFWKQTSEGQSGYGFLTFSENQLNNQMATENTTREIQGVQYSFRSAGDNRGHRQSSTQQHRRGHSDQRHAQSDNYRSDRPPALQGPSSSPENAFYAVTTPPMGYSSPNHSYGTPPAVYQQQMFVNHSTVNVATSTATWSPTSYYHTPPSPSITGARQYHPGVAPDHRPAFLPSMPSSESQRRGPPVGRQSARQRAHYVLVAIPDEGSAPLPFQSAPGMMYNAQPVYVHPDMSHMPSHQIPYPQYGGPVTGQFFDPQLSFSGDSSSSFSNHPSPRNTSPYVTDRAADWYAHNHPHGHGSLHQPGSIAPIRAPLSQPTSVPSQAVAQGGVTTGSLGFTHRDDENKVNELSA